MGKASRFIKALFTFKPPDSPHPPSSSSDVDKPTKRRWSFFKSHRDKPHHHLSALSDPSITRHTPLHHHHSSDHAIAAAAAEVVRMTTRTTVAGDDHRLSGEWAAVRIQSYFRGYLARKALRALKSLVRLQALVRGHIQRKQTAHDLRRMQAVVRTQARVRASRFQITDSPQSTAKGPPTPEKFEHRLTRHNKPSMLKNNRSNLYDERHEKILEVDTTRHNLRRRNLFQPDQIRYSQSQSQSLTTSRGSTVHPLGLSPNGSCEVTSLSVPFRCYPHDIEEQVSLYTAHNSPPFYAVSSKKVGPFTPAKSDSSRSCQSGYSDHPNYMAYTESSRAKVRSLSAPRQRPHFEFPNNIKRYSVYGYGSGAQRGSNMRDSFASKAYPGSGRLDRLGMPVGIGFRESEFSGGYWN